MRSPREMDIALECLRLADEQWQPGTVFRTSSNDVVERAEEYFAFVTGKAADDAGNLPGAAPISERP